MERRPREIYPDVCDAYEENHAMLFDLMGRINAQLSAHYRADRPRQAEHIGGQEELLAMLTSVADYLGA